MDFFIIVAKATDISLSRSAFSDVIISEVAWSGTAAAASDEWIELHNRGFHTIDLENWRVVRGELDLPLSGSIEPNGFFLLERSDDNTVSDVPADQIYSMVLPNTGDSLILMDDSGTVVDSANSNGGPWPGGTTNPEFKSMERASPWLEDLDSSWTSNNAVTRNGLDASGSPINGTPRQPNSQWINLPGEVDLVLSKSGPTTVFAGTEIAYTINLDNVGRLDASGVILTDTLPEGFGYSNDDSGFPMIQPMTSTLVWQVGALPADISVSFILTVTVPEDESGTVTNLVSASTEATETITFNNSANATTNVISAGSPLLLIDAVYYDSYESGEPDEAVRLINVGQSTCDLGGWTLTDGVSSVVFPDSAALPAGDAIWVSKSATAFDQQYGFLPDYELVDSLAGVPDLLGIWPGYSNSGDEVILLDGQDQLQDVVVYEDGDVNQYGWSGLPVMPYTVSSIFSEEGQILYRKRDPDTKLPYADTNRAADWAQDSADAVSGRKVQYPGWDFDDYLRTFRVTETASFEIGIAPDNAFDLIAREISEAQQSIQIASYTFRNNAIGEDLLEALSRGVSVTVLLEGGPAGGIEDQEKYICLKLEESGGECWFMINDPTQNIHDRYRNYHAKYMIVDNQTVIISTENLSPDSLPYDDKSDGTLGRRGVVLRITSASVVEHMRNLWNDDFDPANHLDLLRWSPTHPLYGAPPPGTVPITLTGGSGYSIRFPDPVAFTDTVAIEVIQSPANSLGHDEGLLGLLNSTGQGDSILAEELYEPHYWGESGSDPQSDPNPRLESMLAAARRGVKVRLLLDEYFDDSTNSRSNWSTCRYVNSVAANEGLDFRCALGNPTGLGIHNKMILVRRNGVGFVHVGSLNGSELSSKGNREIAIQIQSDPAYDLLRRMFQYDWPHRAILPIIYNDYTGPKNHALISEVLYDAYGPDDAEFIEIANPTGYPIDLSGYSIGDALSREDFEDVRRFPGDTILEPGETIVVATTGTGFWSLFGFYPDFEILDTLPIVPLLIDDPEWGDPGAFLQLGNLGDEVLLRDPEDEIVDAVAYGSGAIPGVTSCSLVSGPNISLERYPYWRDTDDCQQDFRPWPFPNPGDLP